MEYSFSRDDIEQPIAQLNMEAEAFGHWLSIEMGERNMAQLSSLITVVAQLLAGEKWQYQLVGREFSLQLSRDQAVVQSNSIMQASESDAMEYDADEYDDGLGEMEMLSDAQSGLIASCGLEDFQQLLLAWYKYVEA